jgi:hypothetical protein
MSEMSDTDIISTYMVARNFTQYSRCALYLNPVWRVAFYGPEGLYPLTVFTTDNSIKLSAYKHYPNVTS